MKLPTDLKVIINSAMTLDGKISSYTGNSRISSKKDLVRVHKLDSKILKTAAIIKTIIVVTKQASKDTIEKIKKLGAHVIIVGSKLISLKKLFNMLYKMGYRKILIEGGGELNWSCLHDGIVNELIITIAPIVLGGRNAITLVEGRGYSTISQGIKLKLTKIIQNKNDNEITLYYNN